MTRALIVVRLSRVTDASTSPERQREVCERFITDRGWTVAGIAEDLDVSAGAVAPWDRPSLRPWLQDRQHEYDVIVAYRIDRLVRRVTHLSRMIEWSEDHDKNLVSATESTFDLSTPLGRTLANLIASFAEMELDAISERNANAAQYNIKAGKYRGGPVPAGYRAEKDESGDWRLVTDEILAPVLRDVVARTLEGERMSTIVRDLNERSVPTQKDRQAALNGRTPDGRLWSVSNLRRMLASPTLIGQVVYRPVELDANGNPRKDKGRKVYGPEQVLFGDDGAPVVRAEPLISEADYRSLQRLLAERGEENKQTKRAADTTLLLRVLYCGECGKPMWRLKGGPGRQSRYRCGSTQNGKSCGSGSVTIQRADSIVETNLLELLEEVPYAEKRFDAGEDHAAEIAEIDAKLQSLGEAVIRFPAGSPALENLLAQVDGLSARKAELAALPLRPAGHRYVPTGVTFAEHWASLDSARKNDYLRNNNVRVEFKKLPGEESEFLLTLGDIVGMIESINPDAAGRLRPDMSWKEIRRALTWSY